MYESVPSLKGLFKTPQADVLLLQPSATGTQKSFFFGCDHASRPRQVIQAPRFLDEFQNLAA